MSRAWWFVAGAGAGVYGMVRGRRAAEVLTVDGLRDRVEALTLGARLFRDEVAQGAAERETELRDRFGVLPHGRPELTTTQYAPEYSPEHHPEYSPQHSKEGPT